AGTPFEAGVPTRIAALSQGPTHGCEVTDVGTVRCWGTNASGKAVPSLPSTPGITTRVDVPLPGPARQLGTGTAHTCALLTDGRVFCWGSNSNLQLGPNAPASGTFVPPTEVT